MTKEKIEQIELQALAFSESRNTDNSETARAYKVGCSFGYANGAINEAERAEGLFEALNAIMQYDQIDVPQIPVELRSNAIAALTTYQLSQKVK